MEAGGEHSAAVSTSTPSLEVSPSLDQLPGSTMLADMGSQLRWLHVASSRAPAVPPPTTLV